MKTRKDGQETREQILHAAAEIFGEKGFRDTTHAEICQKCGVNTALINYHFKDKETLYRMAWEYAHVQTLARYPYGGEIPSEETPERQLYGRISALVRQNADPTCHDMKIWRKELAVPTGLLRELRKKMITPLRKGFFDVIQQLLGPLASEDQVKLGTMSVIAQCRVPVSERPCSFSALPKNSSQTAMPGLSTLPDQPVLFAQSVPPAASPQKTDSLRSPRVSIPLAPRFSEKSLPAPLGDLNEEKMEELSPFVQVDLETRILHIWRFSLGGLLELKKERSSGPDENFDTPFAKFKNRVK